MSEAELISNLEKIVLRLGMELRWETGDFSGGIYRRGGQRVLMVNRDLPTFEKIRVLCRAISQQDLSQVYLLPAIRRRIDPWARRPL